jgi:hypothetical protein
MVYERKCAFCGDGYRGFRSNGKFCSDNCRVQFGQFPAKIKSKADKIIDLMAQMRELAEKYPHLVPVLDVQMSRVHEKSTLEWFAVSRLPTELAKKSK